MELAALQREQAILEAQVAFDARSVADQRLNDHVPVAFFAKHARTPLPIPRGAGPISPTGQ